jgi:hypothetical protein
MSIDLGRRLIASGAAPRDKVQAALFLSVVRGIPFTRALVDRGAITERELDEELSRYAGLALRHVAGAPDLVAKLPRAMCRRLCALPTRIDLFTGTVDVAAADPLDPHLEAEFSFHLGAPVRVLRAPTAAVEEAIRRIELSAAQVAPSRRERGRRATPPFPHGAPQSSIPPPPTASEPLPLVNKRGEREEDELPIVIMPAPPTRRGTPTDMDISDPSPQRPFRVPAPPSGRSVVEPQANRAIAAATASARRPAPAPSEPGDDQPRVSFPSSPPPSGPVSSSLPLAVAPPELTAWRGATHGRPALDSSLFSRTSSVSAQRLVDPETAHDRSAIWTTHDVAPATTPSSGIKRVTSDPPPAPHSFAPTPSARMGVSWTLEPSVYEQDAEEDEPQRDTIAGPPPLPFPDPSAILGALTRAATRDEIVKLALGGASLFARRVALFAVKRDGYHGWACNEEFGDEEGLRALLIPSEQSSILATSTATSIYLGPIAETPAHERLLAVMERASPDVAAIAVRVAGRPAAILVADDLGDTLTGTRRMDELARAVGEALARLLAARG